MNSVENYLESLPEDRKEAMSALRQVLLTHLPAGIEEVYLYDMVTYVIPLSLYPPGYHVGEETPLPVISLASQKNYIALYHLWLHTDTKLLNWFQQQYEQTVTTKLDMGKSCIRLKNIKKIPYDLIGELVSKMSVNDIVERYEQSQAK